MKDLMPPGSVPKELDTAIKRLEAGEDPEKIEADMGDVWAIPWAARRAAAGKAPYTRDSGLYDY